MRWNWCRYAQNFTFEFLIDVISLQTASAGQTERNGQRPNEVRLKYNAGLIEQNAENFFPYRPRSAHTKLDRFRDDPQEEPEPLEPPLSPEETLDMALLDCLANDDLEGMQNLIMEGANINYRNPKASETLLHFAVCREDDGIAKWLIEQGANVNAVAHHRMTPLHYAARLGNVQMVRLLINAGAEPHPKNEYNVVPYWYTNREHIDCIVPEAQRREIQALLPNPPLTQILHNGGPIVFGADDPRVAERERFEAQFRAEHKNRTAKNLVEEMGHH